METNKDKKKKNAEDAEILMNNNHSDFVDAVVEMNGNLETEKNVRSGSFSKDDVPSKVSDTFSLGLVLPKIYQKRLHILRDLYHKNYSFLIMDMIDRTLDENRNAIENYLAL